MKRKFHSINVQTSALLVCLIGLSGCFDGSSRAQPFDLNAISIEYPLIPIAVIGSGPAGLCSALYGARARMHTVVFEGDLPGGLLTQTSLVENWPGASSIMGPEIMSNLREHAQKVGASLVRETVESIDVTNWPYRLTLSDGTIVQALSTVIATGAAPKRLGVPGEDTYWGSGVTSCAVCDAPFFKGEEVVVVGGGDSAVEEAIQLAGYASKITILVRKGHLRAAASMQERLKEYPNISIRFNVAVQKILGDDSQVTGVELVHTDTNTTSIMPTSGVFLAIGHKPNTDVFKGVVALDDEGYVVLPERHSQQTSIHGVFAAGDVEDKIYRQAGVSAGHGIKAGLDAVSFLTEIGLSTNKINELKPQFYAVPEPTQKSTIRMISELDELNSLREENDFLAVAFYDQEDEASIQLMSSLEAVSRELDEQLAFARVDHEKGAAIAQSLSAHSTPTLLIFRNGSLVARYTKAMNTKELYNFIAKILEDEDQMPTGAK